MIENIRPARARRICAKARSSELRKRGFVFEDVDQVSISLSGVRMSRREVDVDETE